MRASREVGLIFIESVAHPGVKILLLLVLILVSRALALLPSIIIIIIIIIIVVIVIIVIVIIIHMVATRGQIFRMCKWLLRLNALVFTVGFISGKLIHIMQVVTAHDQEC